MSYSPVNTKHFPDWRWQTTRDMPRPIIASSDAYLKSAHKAQLLLAKENKLIAAIHTNRIPTDVRNVLGAYTLCRWSWDHPLNWMIRALILGRIPDQVIATAVGQNSGVITSYRAVFFDVDIILDDESLIWGNVIRSNPRAALKCADIQKLWLECAYLAGPRQVLVLMEPVFAQYPYLLVFDPPMLDLTLDYYFNPDSQTSDAVLEVLKKRMQPDPSRTIEDLRELYLTLPSEFSHRSHLPQEQVTTADDDDNDTRYRSANGLLEEVLAGSNS